MKRFINLTSTPPLLRPYNNIGNLNFNLDSILCWLHLAVKNSTDEIFHKTPIYWWNKSLDTLKSRLKYLNRKRRTVPYPSIRAAYNQEYFKSKESSDTKLDALRTKHIAHSLPSVSRGVALTNVFSNL